MAINNTGLVAGFDRGLIYPPEPNVCWVAGRDGVQHALPPADRLQVTAAAYVLWRCGVLRLAV
jgi:hypothetical protein